VPGIAATPRDVGIDAALNFSSRLDGLAAGNGPSFKVPRQEIGAFARSCYDSAIEGTTDFDRIGRKGQARRRSELKAVVPAAFSGALEVAAVVVRQSLSDQLAIGVNVETHGGFGMISVLRPTGDASRIDDIDMTA
jgi:hypothetical protein